MFFSSQKYLLILSITLCVIMGIVRYHWGLPFNIIKDCSSVGFSHLEHNAKSRRQSVRDLSSKMLKHRESGDLNPVYVNGWIPLIDSRSVVKGRAETVIAVGYKFCVYRGEGGKVFVTDAYCPHMGADLSAGGKIIGNCIVCPFHGWQFDGKTGKCTKIPYTEKIPDLANVKVWDSCERNGYVFVWHHAENESPTWEIPSVPEIENGTWVYRGRSDYMIHCHIQVERDIAVWNNKKYLRNPHLVKEDKLILRFRPWYSQFYSEHSPTLKDLRQKTLDW